MQSVNRGVFRYVRFLSLVTCIFLAQATTASAATLHALLIGDTLDRTIGPDLQLDINQMRDEMHRIGDYTDMSIELTVLTAAEVTPDGVWAAIDAINPGPDDTIVFYWSGHGYRTYSKGDDPWPYLYFSQYDEGINYTSVIDALDDKGARLVLTLADCCNNRIPDWSAPPVVSPKMGPTGFIASRYRALFLEASGSVFVTSSIIGEYSYSTPSGGLFTIAFLDSLKEAAMESEDAGWEELLDKAAASIEDRQHPDYRVEVSA